MTTKKTVKQAHVANTKFGMGDSYGSGIKNKMGKIKSSYMPGVADPIPKTLKKPPKKLA